MSVITVEIFDFESAKKELDLSNNDFKDFEEAREEAWKEIKKKYGL